MSYYWQ
jgi:hypothetical protein